MKNEIVKMKNVARINVIKVEMKASLKTIPIFCLTMKINTTSIRNEIVQPMLPKAENTTGKFMIF